MVERVAKALDIAIDEASGGDYGFHQEGYERIVRAVILAMREPDDAMRLASKRYKRKAKVYSGPECYRQMIDAALATPEDAESALAEMAEETKRLGLD
jgi:hypothetical protein